MGKLWGKTVAESPPDTGMATVTTAPYRPRLPQNATYNAGAPVACLDRAPDGRSVVLGGRHVLKVLAFDGQTAAPRERVDLRAHITAQNAVRSEFPAPVADQLSVRDVQWDARGEAVFTACASGKIFHYDLTRLASHGGALEFVQMRQDHRQINTLHVNPHGGTMLLSGSQDGVVRAWDVRARVETAGRAGATFAPATCGGRDGYRCHADGVRCVRWSPRNAFVFACGTEMGVVQTWDIRKATAPLLRINAHANNKMCSDVAWHADGNHLATAGADGRVYVWDVSDAANKRQKPKHVISTPAPAVALAWRPGVWSSSARALRCAQLAVSFADGGTHRSGLATVQLWDLARPTIAFKEIRRFDMSPSAFVWHTRDLLWTAGQDCLFTQCDVAFAPRLVDRRTVSTLAFSCKGDVMMFLDERVSASRPRTTLRPPDPTDGGSPKKQVPVLATNPNDSEDDAVSSFLGPRRRAGRRRRPSTRSVLQVSTTPPIAEEKRMLPLEQGIAATGVYRPQQAMAVGHVPGAAQEQVYAYMSTNYLEMLHQHFPPSQDPRLLPDRVASIMEHFARAAEAVHGFRLAQTWRILAMAVGLMLQKRAEYHLQCRMDRARPAQNSTTSLTQNRDIESTSNVTTPTARPVEDSHVSNTDESKFVLPPARNDVYGTTPHMTETDYLPWPNDPEYPFSMLEWPTPLQPYSLIARALAFETKKSALHSSAMVLLLQPLVPPSVIDPFLASAVLRQHHARLMSMRLFVTAALLRKPCYPTTNMVMFGPAPPGCQVAFLCATCRRPREVDRSAASTDTVWRCPRCRAVAAPCALCGHRDQPEPESESAEAVLKTWWLCSGCGHGGHASCMQEWHSSDADGCCPLDGCGHACLPGAWSAEVQAARSDETSRAAGRMVRRAGNETTISGGIDVPPSLAVDRVRKVLLASANPRESDGDKRKTVKFDKTS